MRTHLKGENGLSFFYFFLFGSGPMGDKIMPRVLQNIVPFSDAALIRPTIKGYH